MHLPRPALAALLAPLAFACGEPQGGVPAYPSASSAPIAAERAAEPELVEPEPDAEPAKASDPAAPEATILATPPNQAGTEVAWLPPTPQRARQGSNRGSAPRGRRGRRGRAANRVEGAPAEGAAGAGGGGAKARKARSSPGNGGASKISGRAPSEPSECKSVVKGKYVTSHGRRKVHNPKRNGGGQ